MNTEEILRILRDVTGDARGVDADDVLLSHLHQLSATDRLEFWTAFGRALELLWRNIAEGDQACYKAASFIARLPEDAMPENPSSLAGFLLEDSRITPLAEHPECWRRISNALRILTHLGLGNDQFWRSQLKFWMETGIVRCVPRYRTAALNALVQAVRGVVAGGGMKQQDFARLFNVALETVKFPAIEVYSALVEQTRKEKASAQEQFRPEMVTRDILKAYDDFRAALCVSSNKDAVEHLALLERVVSAWLKDEFNEDLPEIRGEIHPPWHLDAAA
ncbi:MAG: hypothetical protein WBN82_08215 [Porticoccaceae bacterium]